VNERETSRHGGKEWMDKIFKKKKRHSFFFLKDERYGKKEIWEYKIKIKL
jgi:hypothetical protein